MDTDTVGASHGHEKLLRQFEEEKIPILLGTQMVAKGLDFENVTLVGVLCADASLYIDNYRAPERTFSLLSQVVGRAGRGSKQGRAIIQTFTPENEVIRAAAAQDYDAFYESEIRMRRLRRYPPFADLFSFTVTGADESRVIRAAKALRDALDYAVERREELKPLSIEVLGPAGASVVKVNNRYRYRVFLVGKGCPALRRLVAEYLYAFYQHKEKTRHFLPTVRDTIGGTAMAIREIRKKGDPCLEKVCHPVTEFNERLHLLLDDMRETLEESGGVGLAAPQVGILRRVCIVEDSEGEIIELVNPEIVKAEGEQTGLEGCLSLPGRWGIVTRPYTVRVRAQDRDGATFEVEDEDITARCFCHEIEHLDGHLFSEHCDRLLTDEELEQYLKEHEDEYEREDDE